MEDCAALQNQITDLENSIYSANGMVSQESVDGVSTSYMQLQDRRQLLSDLYARYNSNCNCGNHPFGVSSPFKVINQW